MTYESSGSPRAGWLEGWPLQFLGAWHERRNARRSSVESLRLFRELAATQPALTGLARYEEVVARRTGLPREDARRVLRRAEDSFARWPVERPLKFRDVVQYLVVHECLNADPSVVGTRTRLTTIIAEVIPVHL